MGLLIALIINSINPGFEFLRIENMSPGIDAINGVWGNYAQLSLSGDFAGFNYTSWFLDESIYSIYAKKGSWGVRFRYFNMGEVEYQGEQPRDDLMLKFSPYASELSIGRAFRIDDETSFGVGATGFMSRLYETTATGYSLSAGLLYMPHKVKGLSIAAYIKDFGFKRAYIGTPINVPTEAAAMFQYKIKDRAVVGYGWKKALTFKSDSISSDLENTHIFYGKLMFNDVEVFASYEKGQTVIPLTVGLSFSVKNRLRFFYIYRHGFYNLNSPFMTGIQMEF